MSSRKTPEPILEAELVWYLQRNSTFGLFKNRKKNFLFLKTFFKPLNTPHSPIPQPADIVFVSSFPPVELLAWMLTSVVQYSFIIFKLTSWQEVPAEFADSVSSLRVELFDNLHGSSRHFFATGCARIHIGHSSGPLLPPADGLYDLKFYSSGACAWRPWTRGVDRTRACCQ